MIYPAHVGIRHLVSKTFRVATALLLCGSLWPQSAPTATAVIVGAGYSAPLQSIKAAPGQLLSLMIYGLDYRLQNPAVVTSLPLPTVLAGCSVSLQQGGTQNTLPVSLLGVQQTPCSLTATPGLCPALTIITVQIPFEVLPDCQLCGRPPLLAYLIVSENGVSKASIALSLPGDNIHIVDACDTTALLLVPPNQGVSCGKLVLHSIGSRVEPANPARVGEQLVMYALGLGQTQPLVPTGEATPSPSPQFASAIFGLHFDSSSNAPPSLPTRGNAPRPVYTALVPGFVGLYQINFTVPPAPTEAPYHSCGVSIVPIDDLLPVFSSLTVTVFGPWSFDGAGVCVQT